MSLTLAPLLANLAMFKKLFQNVSDTVQQGAKSLNLPPLEGFGQPHRILDPSVDATFKQLVTRDHVISIIACTVSWHAPVVQTVTTKSIQVNLPVAEEENMTSSRITSGYPADLVPADAMEASSVDFSTGSANDGFQGSETDLGPDEVDVMKQAGSQDANPVDRDEWTEAETNVPAGVSAEEWSHICNVSAAAGLDPYEMIGQPRPPGDVIFLFLFFSRYCKQ